ncbi:MAG TPA: 50S ribosomal protein L24 [Parachlamydiales bacterium]|nr:50S ribosomal protein L24 [Parachlamydiales bacterium]
MRNPILEGRVSLVPLLEKCGNAVLLKSVLLLRRSSKMSKRLKKNDKVVVITGNDKGRVGKILSKQKDRVIVQGINVRKRHFKRRTQETRSEIIEIERPIALSNVSACNEKEKPVRLKVRMNQEGKKELYYLDEGKEILYRVI